MKWEYSVIDLRQAKISDIPTSDIMVKAGLEGWELVSVDNGIAYFKRPIQVEEQKQTFIQWPPKHTDK